MAQGQLYQGDPVIVMAGASPTGLAPVAGFVSSGNNRLSFVVRNAKGGYTYPWQHFYHTEGILWIRGHHAMDSEEVQALLAAHALYQSAQQ